MGFHMIFGTSTYNKWGSVALGLWNRISLYNTTGIMKISNAFNCSINHGPLPSIWWSIQTHLQ